MRNLNKVDAMRLPTRHLYGDDGDDGNGAFSVPSPIDGAQLIILATSGLGWDHVSVHRKNRCPNWVEMEHVKRLFFEDNEAAMELHVPVEKHINRHPFTLHLWRPNDGQEIPMPPDAFV